MSPSHGCRVYWGTHGCKLERGHEGPHLCTCADDPDWASDDESENVGGPPYYGPGTAFYGEDACDAVTDSAEAFLAELDADDAPAER